MLAENTPIVTPLEFNHTTMPENTARFKVGSDPDGVTKKTQL